MVEIILENIGLANTVISLVGSGIMLGLCGLTTYKMRRMGVPTKRHYLSGKEQTSTINQYGQIGFDLNERDNTRYFIAKL